MLHQVQGGPENRITRVSDVAGACRELDENTFDIVLLDLTLPDSEGAETVHRVARSAPGTPIVVLTGTDDEALGLACIQAGAQDYVPKNELRVPLLGRVIGYALARAAEADARQRLEQEVLESSERERQRIAHDLHDDLGQQLTGIALLGRSLAERLASRDAPEASAARELTELIRRATGQSMALARGLDPLTEHGAELPTALEALAQRGELMFSIRCYVSTSGEIPRFGPTVSTHVYRIAQEALTNAVKHGQARQVQIALRATEGGVDLVVTDDGAGVANVSDVESGQGLRIMGYRARVIGATLSVEAREDGGTRVRCSIPSTG
jgi:signal transduction histidine kinase